MRLPANGWNHVLRALAVLTAAVVVSCGIDGGSPLAPPPPPRQHVEVQVDDGPSAQIEATRLVPPGETGIFLATADSAGRALLSLPSGSFAITATLANGLAGRSDLVIPPGSGTSPDTALVSIPLGVRGVIRGVALREGGTLGDEIGIETAEAHYRIGTIANAFGRYALTVPSGRWTVIFVTLGAPPETLTATIAAFGDTTELPTVTLGN